ncbi:hypothetical protein [Lactobacillus intestinalis]|nr:hypothetical protein [Lactobacillus intestinalis]UTW40130.1 hypothetical protein KBW87_07025 [Lactobacillus intestinalis]
MKQRELLIIVVSAISGIFGGVISSLFITRKLPVQEIGDLASWVSGIGTVIAFIVAYVELVNSKKRFEKEHRPELKVFTGWKDAAIVSRTKDDNESYDTGIDNPGIELHIIPINGGLSAGIYRYVGICKKDKLNEVSFLIKKVKIGNITAEEVDKLATLIYYTPADIGQTSQSHDMTGMSLLYPNDSKLFQTIEPNHVGKIIDKKRLDIEKKLNINISKDVVEVLYMDLNMKLYNFEVKTYTSPKSIVNINLNGSNELVI